MLNMVGFQMDALESCLFARLFGSGSYMMAH